MSVEVPADLVALADQLADAARPVVRRFFRAPFAMELKADRTPVTEADRAAEAAMREIITAEAPDHGILGEEFGAERLDAEWVWVLDPIDGTQGFVTGKPLFGILIGLAHRGHPVLGVIDQPVLEERWLGGPGHPTTFNDQPARARPCGELDLAWLYATTPELFEGDDMTRFQRVSAAAHRTLYGADCYAYGLVALGHVDLVVEAGLHPYDFCAPAAVVAGAGGIMTDWAGAPLTLESDGRVIAAGDRRMHGAALKAMAG